MIAFSSSRRRQTSPVLICGIYVMEAAASRGFWISPLLCTGDLREF